MLFYKDIIKEENVNLRRKSEEVVLPLSEEDLSTLKLMDEYLKNGYNDDLVKKYGLRPGVGISAVQINILKRMFIILGFDEKGYLHHYTVINPKIISHSEETTYLPMGEGCLSVDREVEGLIHRPRKVKASVYLYDWDKNETVKTTLTLKDYMAVVFQHEYDHLNGILFVDRIDKDDPFFIPENSKPISFSNEEK